MNISLENIDKVNGVLTVNVEKADYENLVTAELKKLRKKANIPGFRPGMVPMSLVKRQFGTSVKVEEINKLLQTKMYDYIRENKVNMLGEPLPQANDKLDFAKDDNFEFKFDIAIAPEFDASLSEKDTVPYYNITISDEMIDNQVKMYTQRAGNYEKVEQYQEGDMLKGLISELDENDNDVENGLQVDGAIMAPSHMKDEGQKELFKDVKPGDIINFNPATAFGSDLDVATLLKIKKEEAEKYKGDFSFKIEEITRFQEAPLDEKVFDSVFGKGVVKTADEFKAKIREKLEAQLKNDSRYRFMLDVRDYLEKRIGKLEFPDALMKKMFLNNAKDKGAAFVDEHYDESISELTWQLIEQQLIKDNEIKVDDNDLKETAKQATVSQFARYGMLSIPDDVIENYANELLKNKEQANSLVENCIENKLADALEKKVTLEKKDVTVEEFNKLFGDAEQ